MNENPNENMQDANLERLQKEYDMVSQIYQKNKSLTQSWEDSFFEGMKKNKVEL